MNQTLDFFIKYMKLNVKTPFFFDVLKMKGLLINLKFFVSGFFGFKFLNFPVLV